MENIPLWKEQRHKNPVYRSGLVYKEMQKRASLLCLITTMFWDIYQIQIKTL